MPARSPSSRALLLLTGGGPDSGDSSTLVLALLALALLAAAFATWWAWRSERARARLADQGRRREEALRGDLEREVAERTARLERSEAEYRTLFTTSPVGLWRLSTVDDRILTANAKAAELLGFPDVESLCARADLAALDPTGHLAAFLAERRRSAEAGQAEVTLALPDGTPRTFSLSGIHQPERECIAGSLEDITWRKEAEEALEATNAELAGTMDRLKQAQETLIESEKLSALGGLVAGVAHEINTPIGIALTAATHLREAAERLQAAHRDGALTRSELARHLEQADTGTGLLLDNLRKAVDLINSFKQVAVDQSSEAVREIDLETYIGEILTSLQPHLKGQHVAVEVEIPRPIRLQTHAGALSGVLTNFITNALIHAFPGRAPGRIHITAREERDTTTLRFRDDGVGMPPEVRTRVFEAFFTTRRGEGGSGLGLSLVYNLVTQKLGGRIRCTSTPGKGTEFTLTLPTDAGQPRHRERGLDRQVLVVDDDPTVRTVTAEVLKNAGCRVRTAENGEEGLRIYREEHEGLHVVVLDMVMPGLSGEQVLEAMRSISTRPAILLASGFALNPEDAQRLLDKGATGFLKKPIPMARLKEAIAGVPKDT